MRKITVRTYPVSDHPQVEYEDFCMYTVLPSGQVYSVTYVTTDGELWWDKAPGQWYDVSEPPATPFTPTRRK